MIGLDCDLVVVLAPGRDDDVGMVAAIGFGQETDEGLVKRIGAGLPLEARRAFRSPARGPHS